MSLITDEIMRENLSHTKAYCVVLVRKGPNWEIPQAKQIVWEHVRRNFELRQAGKLAIVCPLGETTELRGIGIFDADEDETSRLMMEDPAIKAEVLTFEVFPGRGFPGDALP